jgi:general secretion pathway protein J
VMRRRATSEATPGRRSRRAVRGFTLIEALVATALMGLVLAALATITAQWLPNWNRGIARAQRAELVSVSLDRLTADIKSAEFIEPSRGSKLPLFDGSESSIILVRSSLGPNTRPGLEVVRIAQVREDQGGAQGGALVRSTMRFAPFAPNSPLAGQLKFANPVALLRDPYRISFAYAGRDGSWKTTWQNQTVLPAAVRVTVSDAATQQTLSISTTALIHVELPACVVGKSKGDCMAQPGGQNTGPNEAPAPPPPPPSMRGDLATQRSVL